MEGRRSSKPRLGLLVEEAGAVGGVVVDTAEATEEASNDEEADHDDEKWEDEEEGEVVVAVDAAAAVVTRTRVCSTSSPMSAVLRKVVRSELKPTARE